MSSDLDLTAKLPETERMLAEARLKSISPDDGKYFKPELITYLSADAEWRACAYVQQILMATFVDFELADQRHLEEVIQAVMKFNPLNASLIEAEITKHDQLAVVEELGRHTSEETKALLHRGATSYDILDTARSYLLKECWPNAVRKKAAETIEKLCNLADVYIDVLQVGRTHLQHTSPVPFGATLAGYAARLAECVEDCDAAFDSLRGKLSGIVGTGASIEAIVGEGNGQAFEKAFLHKLGLEPDYRATQIVQKKKLCDAGHQILMLMKVLAEFANNIRILYSSDIDEVTSRDSKQRLGGSSADAGKNNPINWENIAGKAVVVQSGMQVLYAMMDTDLQRDLRGSVQARYQPGGMISETYESFCRASKALDQLSVNEDKMAENLAKIRNFPSEAMVAITRKYAWKHPEYGIGHDAVKKFSQIAKKQAKPLIEVAIQDPHFSEFFFTLTEKEQYILDGQLELYVGFSKQRARQNIEYARLIAN